MEDSEARVAELQTLLEESTTFMTLDAERVKEHVKQLRNAEMAVCELETEAAVHEKMLAESADAQEALTGAETEVAELQKQLRVLRKQNTKLLDQIKSLELDGNSATEENKKFAAAAAIRAARSPSMKDEEESICGLLAELAEAEEKLQVAAVECKHTKAELDALHEVVHLLQCVLPAGLCCVLFCMR